MYKKILLEEESKNIKQSKDFSRKAVKYFSIGDSILLYGDLGSGKTFLTGQFVKLLGLKVEISSPSFSIVNQYTGSLLVNHIDLYRIDNFKDIDNLGLDDLLSMDSINFIEWPHLIEPMINWKHYRIRIDFIPEDNIRKFRLIEYYPK